MRRYDFYCYIDPAYRYIIFSDFGKIDIGNTVIRYGNIPIKTCVPQSVIVYFGKCAQRLVHSRHHAVASLKYFVFVNIARIAYTDFFTIHSNLFGR